MTQRGLQVITLDPKAAAEFRAAADQLVTTMRGGDGAGRHLRRGRPGARRLPEDQRQVVAMQASVSRPASRPRTASRAWRSAASWCCRSPRSPRGKFFGAAIPGIRRVRVEPDALARHARRGDRRARRQAADARDRRVPAEGAGQRRRARRRRRHRRDDRDDPRARRHRARQSDRARRRA